MAVSAISQACEHLQAAKASIPSISVSRRIEWKRSKGVLGAPQLHVDDRLPRGATELLDELTRVVGGYERVLITVRDQERRRVRVGVLGGRRGEWLPCAVDGAVVAVKADGSRDGRVCVLEARLERWVVGREGCSSGKVRPCRAPRDEHVGRVGAMFVRVLTCPADYLLDVDQVVGERRGRAQAVIGADADPAATRKPVE